MAPSLAVILSMYFSIQGSLGSIPGKINLAYRKPASQSSTDLGVLGLASNAVDGSSDRDTTKGSCSMTVFRRKSEWWMLDLLDMYTVRSLRMTTRKDYLLTNFTVEVSKENPFMLPGFPLRTNAQICISANRALTTIPNFPIECDQPLMGRYVRVIRGLFRAQERLVLCEFEVYEDEIIVKYPLPESPNLALRKPASQSHTRRSAFATNSVDGLNNGIHFRGSCSHTNEEPLPNWWMVDLEDSYTVQIIRITNRNDCCDERLANFVIEVSDTDPSTLDGFPGRTNASVCVTVQGPVPIPVPVNYECDKPVTGRYVRLFNGNDVVNMCEFEVYEVRPPITTAFPKHFQNGINGQWVFVYVTSYGFQSSQISISERGFLTDCARKRLKDKDNMMSAPYIQIDLPVGTCRFHTNIADGKGSTSSRWTMYELVRA